ncbi:MAG: methylated-DNA--[protein]-cysteine S-methyltransferase [Ginsengibacter sp.]
MQTDTAYYSSPIGTMFIKSVDNTIEEISFINTLKGLKIDEDKIDLTIKSSSLIQKCIQQLKEYFEGKRKQFELAINQNGTDFQKKVWNDLLHIPFGNTISYLELSRRIGNVKAIRAVGTCNGSNKLCIVVPCHRVIGIKGDLIGYGGDLWRKKWLLEHEAKYANGVQKLF